MLGFQLITKHWQDASSIKGVDADFLLEENDWNDFGYYTTYHLHITEKRTECDVPIYLGAINIMKLGQKESELYLLRKDLGKEILFHELPTSYYSITFSLDLYKSLSTYLNESERKDFIQAFRLILKEDDEYYPIVKDDECFNISLLRNATMSDFNLQKGIELLLLEGTPYNLREKTIVIKYNYSEAPISLDFSTIKDADTGTMPNGIIAFIGKNGSGKSTALYHLASLLYASPRDRDAFLKSSIGKVEPLNLGITQLMIFSYSPFDNFTLPGEYGGPDLILWARRIERREGRFIYCGLRDVQKEAEMIIEAGDQARFSSKLQKSRVLKDLSILAIESSNALNEIYQNEEKKSEFKDFLRCMKINHPELYLQINNLKSSLEEDDCWRSAFNSLSAGHKFFVHSMLHLIAYCDENAVIFFDEPENHLQSPLLSFMLGEIRKILAKRKSVMLIATHSPVVIQETLSRNVRIVRRDGEKVSFYRPSIETFGENLGAISSEVFDLTTDKVNFFNAIDELYSKFECNKMGTYQEVLGFFEDRLNGISSQAVQYIVTKHLAEKG